MEITETVTHEDLDRAIEAIQLIDEDLVFDGSNDPHMVCVLGQTLQRVFPGVNFRVDSYGKVCDQNFNRLAQVVSPDPKTLETLTTRFDGMLYDEVRQMLPMEIKVVK